MIRRSTTSSSAGSFAKLRICRTQKSGRLKVVTATEAVPGVYPSGVSTDQCAFTSSAGSSAESRSNQYQPPSPKFFSGRSKSIVPPSTTTRESWRLATPRAELR
jgi:hypothetical protein